MWRIEIHPSILTIGPLKWSKISDPSFPFTSYHFLAAMETSDCVGERTGWFPQFIGFWEGEELLGALVLYLKTNSYGEYIFDFAWSEAYQRYGLPYYPKLTSAVPFTPATGPKLLIKPGADVRTIGEALLKAGETLAEKCEAHSEHALFVPKDQHAIYESSGFFLRDSFQYHWHNSNFTDFASFTATLRSKRRKEILRERNQVASAPIKIRRILGAELKASDAENFYQFYLSTIEKRSSYDYLTEGFFKAVFKDLKENILLVQAEEQTGTPVAAALYFFGDQVLFGRNWGCLAEYKALHFELCYYQGIEFAIEKGLKRFEAGAQGEHKFQRGFMPSLTYSAHKIQHPQMNRAIQDHVRFERKEIEKLFEHYQGHSPFRA